MKAGESEGVFLFNFFPLSLTHRDTHTISWKLEDRSPLNNMSLE